MTGSILETSPPIELPSSNSLVACCLLISVLFHGLFFIYWEYVNQKRISKEVIHSQTINVALKKISLPLKLKPKTEILKNTEPVVENKIVNKQVVKENLLIAKNSIIKKTSRPIESSVQPKSPKKLVDILKEVSRMDTIFDVKEEAKKKESQKKEQAANVLAEQVSTYEQQLIAWLNQYKRYPLAAQKRHQQGTVTATFTIDSHGMLISYKIHQTSGYRLLDKAVGKLLKRASPMPEVPADMRAGKQYFSYTVPIVFNL